MRVSYLIYLHLLCYLDISGTQSAVVLPGSVEDYTWKDYKGLVPSTAVPGGKDENGVTTYIGQFTTVAEYNWIGTAGLHTIPAVINAGSQQAVAAYNGRALVSNATTNTKVLCYGNYANRYQWYSPTSTFSTNCRFVIGGYEDDIPMYIGRADQNKEIVIGKVFSDTTNHRAGLISPYKGGQSGVFWHPKKSPGKFLLKAPFPTDTNENRDVKDLSRT